MRKVLTSFEIFSQLAGPIGKPNQPIHWVLFSKTTVWVLCLVCVGSWSFRVGIALCFFCWIPDSLRNILKKFENFSQFHELVGKLNQPVHYVQFSEIAILVLCFICVDSHLFGVRIALCLFFWIPDSMKKVLKNFENFSQPDEPVDKPDQPVHWVKFSEIAT